MSAVAATLVGALLAAAPAPAAAASPASPLETGVIEPNSAPKLNTALVDLKTLIPELVLDIRYSTPNNFLRRILYDRAVCLLRPQVAAKLVAVQKSLAKHGLGLKAWDCYRPFSVQRVMWEAMPKRGFVAPPALGGSNHNRGAAVDVTVINLKTGAEVEMPTPFDDFTRAAYANSPLPSATARRNRTILQNAMEAAGMKATYMEWWHFDDPDALQYKTLDEPLAR